MSGRAEGNQEKASLSVVGTFAALARVFFHCVFYGLACTGYGKGTIEGEYTFEVNNDLF